MTAFRDVLRSHQEAINRLNVYPVPDGDTGTNMALTAGSVVAELSDLGEADMVPVCKAISHGSLMGARGNSGVILSQLLRGMAGVLAEGSEVGGTGLARAFRAASEAADKAVLRPVEGTILTVARAAADGAERLAEEARGAVNGKAGPVPGAEGLAEVGIEGIDVEADGVVAVLDAARREASAALDRTPELLPVLAQAGVVDAGGAGYLLLLDAFLAVADGRPLPEAPQVAVGSALDGSDRDEGSRRRRRKRQGRRASSLTSGEEGQGVDPGSDATSGTDLRYEVMFLLETTGESDKAIGGFKDVWAGLGDSIVVVGGDGLYNCHIHTDDIGAAVEAGIDAGRPRDIRVTDLAEQVEEERWVREGAAAVGALPEEESGPVPRTAVVAVANGEGIGRIFRSLGVHHLVAGGQSMNPSTEEILKVVDALASPEVIVLPNNENIIPVALQVCELSSKLASVVPTSGIVEGFAALLEYDPEAPASDNARSMAGSARRIVAGEVTRAVRAASTPAGRIEEGDWLGMSRDGVEIIAGTMEDAACRLLEKLTGSSHELVTLIEGEGTGEVETRRIREWISERFPSLAVEVHHGGQPLYPYLISIE